MQKTEEQNLKLLELMKNNLFFMFRILALFIFLPSFLFAQIITPKFEHLNIQDGLSQSDVTTIIQDSKGLIWLGTQDGLNVYNGFEVEVMGYDLLDSTSISDNSIHIIYEDKEQLLWVGNRGGLDVYDRKKKSFKNIFDASKFSEIRNDVWAITEDAHHNIWVGSERRLFKVDRATLQVSQIELRRENLNSGKTLKIRKLLFIDEEQLLIATEGNGVIKYNVTTRKQKNFNTTNSNLKSNLVWDILKEENGKLWITTSKGVNLYNSKTNRYSSNTFMDNVVAQKIVKTIYKDKEGLLWVGTKKDGLYVLHPMDNKFDHYAYTPNISSGLSNNLINTIYEDNSGVIWIGTQAGVSKVDKRKQLFKHYKSWTNGLNSISDNMVWSIYGDSDSILYIGTQKGLDIFNRYTEKRKTLIPDFALNDLQKERSIYAIYKDHNGVVYVGTEQGIYFVDEGRLKYLGADKGLENKTRTFHIIEDKIHRLWVATKEGLIIVSPDRKSQTAIRLINSEISTPPVKTNAVLEYDLSNGIRQIFEDSKGSIWLGTERGICKVIEKDNKFSFKLFQNISNDINSLTHNTVMCFYEDDQGFIWVGTLGGLNRFDPKTGKVKSYTYKDGLANNVIYGLLPDEAGNLWMSTNKGLSKFNLEKEQFISYHEGDGLQSDEFNAGAYFKSTTGELFFGGPNGFNAFFPKDIVVNQVPPKVLLTNFYLFNKPVAIGENSILSSDISEMDEIVLKYKQNVISFEFASLHYSSSSKNQHFFMLEGFDEDWVNIGNNRRANYTNLDPNTYVFRVKAANSDGVESINEARIVVIVKPPFWATWWFRAFVILLIAFGVFTYYRIRINRVKSQKLLLMMQVRERTHEVIKQKEEIEAQKKLIEAEKEKTENLLMNVLPQEMAEELKAKGKATARHYRMTSIMFADFKGFTKIAENIKPQELVAQLDGYFTIYDNIIEKYDIEKIKTIGDAYMCAGGIPIRNKSNPIDVVLAGLEIQRAMKELKENGKEPWDLRLGIHTGEVIAGVIGTKRFAYDIWGDSVNVASRMEASAEVGKVNISGVTYALVKEFFDCEHRGKIKAKNKGEVDMYYVHAIKKELSVNGEGIKPNELFYKYVDLHLYSGINYRKAEKYILNRLEEELPENLHYHDISHTLDVCAAVERLALMEGIEGDDIFILKTAALYHDAGFVKQYSNNEEIGDALAQEVLPKFGYTEKQIKKVGELISATKIPHKPKNHLEQIICDADLDYLGRGEFHLIADRLKRELMERDIVNDQKQWDTLQIKFLEAHKYFTKSAIDLRKEMKIKHIEEIKERLKKMS